MQGGSPRGVAASGLAGGFGGGEDAGFGSEGLGSGRVPFARPRAS